jgi:S-adenosylmethionine decarboxylase proenzyme
MANGVHLIVDVFDIAKVELLEDLNCAILLACQIVHKCNLTVVDQVHHQFSPNGYTSLYLLSESHMSLHSYPEKKCLSFDLYCCNPNLDVKEVLHYIHTYFDKPKINQRVIYR